MSDLAGNPEDRFSQNEARIKYHGTSVKLMTVLGNSCRVVFAFSHESLKMLATSLTRWRPNKPKAFIVRFRFRIKHLFSYKRYVIDNFRPNSIACNKHTKYVLYC